MLRKSRIFKITILVPFKVSDKGTELTNYFYFIRLTRARFVKNENLPLIKMMPPFTEE